MEHEDQGRRKIKEAEERENKLVVAMDGSRRRTRGVKRMGAGVVVKGREQVIWQGAWGLGRKSNNYDRESFALVTGMEIANHLSNNDANVKTLSFYSNSKSAIANITHTHTSQQISIHFLKWVHECIGKGPNQHIHTTWVPGHKGIEINEMADKEVCRGCRREDCIQVSL